MLYISEFIPNPTGSDAKGEWIEIYNSGTVTVDLGNWKIVNSSGKKAGLSGIIKPGEYRVFTREQSKLTLKNSGEALYLYSPTGKLEHVAEYAGSAPEGKSFVMNKSGFRLGTPTPGGENIIETFPIIDYLQPEGTNLSPSPATIDVLGMMSGAGILFAGAVTFIVIAYEIIPKQFRRKNKENSDQLSQ